MSILFLGAEDLDFIQIGGSAATKDTRTITYNTTYSRCSIQTAWSYGNFKNRTAFTPSAELWFHSDIYAGLDYFNDNTFLKFYSEANGRSQIEIRYDYNNDPHWRYAIYYRNSGGTITGLGTFDLLKAGAQHPKGQRATWDIHVKFHASAGAVDVYCNGSNVYSYAGALVTQDNVCDGIRFHGNGDIVDLEGYSFSQVAVATTSTVNWNVQTIAPNASGDLSYDSGVYSDIDDLVEDGRGLVRLEDVNSQGLFNFQNLSGTDATRIIEGLKFSTRLDRYSSSAPPDVQSSMKTNSSITLSSNKGYTAASTNYYDQSYYDTNPITSATWTGTEINAVQFGFKAVT